MRELVTRGARLIVTVDCGSNSAASIAVARQAGADVVVLDHHQVGAALPEGVPVVNPNREDDLSGQGHLCAAGVVFLALVQTARVLRAARPDLPQPDLLLALDLVALATVCDVVPLTGVNRAFVVKGLLAIKQQRNVGLAELARTARIGEPVNVFHLGFLIGPRINAGGRIGDAALGSRLLATDDPVEAAAIAEVLGRLNQERQGMEQAMLAEARAEADAELAGGAGPAVMVTGRDGWHPGIVGLLASRLKDHARRPVFAIAFNANGVGTGSGRSVPGFDLGRLVRGAFERGLIEKGGGHAMAAGITVHRGRLGELRAYFEEQAAAEILRLRDEETLQMDAALSAEGATQDLLDALEQAGPFGAGYPAPIFVLPRHQMRDVRAVGSSHLRVELRSDTGATLQAMAFRSVGTKLGDFLERNRGCARTCRRTVAGELLERRAQRAVQDRRRGPEPAVRLASADTGDSRKYGLQPREFRQPLLRRLVADTDRLVGAMEFRQADMAEFRLERQVRRVARKPCPRNAILDDVEGIDHDAADAEPRLRLHAPAAPAAVCFDQQLAGIVLDHRGAAEQVVVEIYGDHQGLLIGATNRDRNWIDQRPVDQHPLVGDDRLEDAGQGIGGAHRRDQRAAGQPDFMSGADFRCHANERLRQIVESHAVQMLLHARIEFHAAEQAVSTEVEVKQAEDAPFGQAARELLQMVELAGQVTTADQRPDRSSGDHADFNADLVERAKHADMGPAARRAAAKRERNACFLDHGGIVRRMRGKAVSLAVR